MTIDDHTIAEQDLRRRMHTIAAELHEKLGASRFRLVLHVAACMASRVANALDLEAVYPSHSELTWSARALGHASTALNAAHHLPLVHQDAAYAHRQVVASLSVVDPACPPGLCGRMDARTDD